MNERAAPAADRATVASPAADPAWARPLAVAAFVAALVIVKLAVAGSTAFIRDEAYYSLWALHPLAAGYFDHPPAVAWFIAAGYAIAGQSELAARLLAVLATIPVCLAIHRTASIAFGDGRIAALSVYFFASTPGAMVGLLVITPDAPSMLFWALSIWAAAELMRSGDGRWWLAFGLFAGLGLSAKYTGLFLGAGIVLWLIAHRANRRWFASVWLYAGGMLALAIFAPVIAWNLGNDLSSFSFQMGRSTRGLQWFEWTDTRHLPEFLASQMALLLPGLFVLATAALALFFAKRAYRSDAAFGLLVWTSVPALAYFLLFSLHSAPQGNWTWPLYPQWAILGAWAALRWEPASKPMRWLQRWTRKLQVPIGLVLAALIFAQALWQPVRLPVSDHTLGMHGWRAIATELEAERRRAGVRTVLVRDYGLYGYLETYGQFGAHGYRALPLDEFHRYGFVDLPASDDAVEWPVLVAVPSDPDRQPVPPATLDRITPAPQWFTRLIRPGADGVPAGAVDLYRMERPERPLFGG
ncbi:MAG: glycosyltransferase family 39 protein [Roseitalea porphyridii]|jgi:hypothetical protein|uniref:glycosyltransferase family 39 protein n=1 Tax=Roseitalea porphyridii TaxID=1852022 RepID=UPI0032EC2B5B